MSATLIFVISLACLGASIFLGSALRGRLPEHHLRDDSKETIKMAAGLLATMVALILGLLVGSTKSTFDSISNEITQNGAAIMALDHALARYGTETKEIRSQLRHSLAASVQAIWPEYPRLDGLGIGKPLMSGSLDKLIVEMDNLTPANDKQRLIQSRALQMANDLLQSNLLLIEQNQAVVSPVLLVVLIAWLSILFMSFSLLTPHNSTNTLALLVSAASISAAIFLILEMSHPFHGMIKVSGAPLQKALTLMGQ